MAIWAVASLTCDNIDGCCHTLLTQATDGPTLCPIVSAVHFGTSLQQDEMLYVVNVTGEYNCVNALHSNMVPNDAKLQSVLDSYKDHFPTELPSTLHPPAT